MTYFKPWERKLGVVTLIIACAAMVGWIRTYSVRDSINLPTGSSSAFQFISGEQCLTLAAMWSVIPDREMAAFRLYRHYVNDSVWLHA